MKRYTEEEKAEILKEVESLGNVSLVAKKQGMPSTIIQNWIRKRLSKSNPSKVRRLKKKYLFFLLKILSGQIKTPREHQKISLLSTGNLFITKPVVTGTEMWSFK